MKYNYAVYGFIILLLLQISGIHNATSQSNVFQLPIGSNSFFGQFDVFDLAKQQSKGILSISAINVNEFLNPGDNDELPLFDDRKILIFTESSNGQALPSVITTEEDILNERVLLPPGQYDVFVRLIEEGSDELINIDDEISFIGQCDDKIEVLQENACTIDFEEADQLGDTETEDIGPDTSDSLLDETDDETLDELGDTETEDIQIGTSITTGTLPVDVCLVNLPTLSDTQKNEFGFFQKPVSATYIFDGTISTTKLGEILKKAEKKDDKVNPGYKSSKQTQMIVDIQFDNNPNDNIQVNLVNSPFFSQVYSKQEPFHDKTAGFSITNIRTECKFPTVVRALTSYQESSGNPESQEKIKALGKLTEVIPDKGTVENTLNDFKYLTKENGLTASTQNTTINPPFVLCNNKFISPTIQNPTSESAVQENKVNADGVISQYLIKMAISDSGISQIRHFDGDQDVSLRIVVDTVIDDAKIIDTNNQDIKANLVIEPNTPDVEVIELPILEIVTNCYDINYSVDMAQNNVI